MFVTRLSLRVKKYMINFKKEIESKIGEELCNELETVVNFLKDKEFLLVIDNVEDALREEGAAFRETL
jgi:hypothetical protein